MDWFFNGLNDFFQWCFRGMEHLEMPFNWFMIFATAALTIWWMIQMFRHKEDHK